MCNASARRSRNRSSASAIAGLRPLVRRDDPHRRAEPLEQPGPLAGPERRRAGDVEPQLDPRVFAVLACWPPGPPLPVNRHSSSSSGIRHDRDTTSTRSREASPASSPREDGTGADYGRAVARLGPLRSPVDRLPVSRVWGRRHRRARRRRIPRSTRGRTDGGRSGAPTTPRTVPRRFRARSSRARAASSSTATRPVRRRLATSSTSRPRRCTGRAAPRSCSRAPTAIAPSARRTRSTSRAAPDRAPAPAAGASRSRRSWRSRRLGSRQCHFTQRSSPAGALLQPGAGFGALGGLERAERRETGRRGPGLREREVAGDRGDDGSQSIGVCPRSRTVAGDERPGVGPPCIATLGAHAATSSHAAPPARAPSRRTRRCPRSRACCRPAGRYGAACLPRTPPPSRLPAPRAARGAVPTTRQVMTARAGATRGCANCTGRRQEARPPSQRSAADTASTPRGVGRSSPKPSRARRAATAGVGVWPSTST